MNRDKQITGVFAGDLEQAHERGCESVRRTAMAPVGEPCDIVITSNSGYPLDLNLYQAVKGMSAAAQIVKEGGAIVLAADCWDGIPDHGQYKRLLFEAQGPAELLESIRSAGIPSAGHVAGTDSRVDLPEGRRASVQRQSDRRPDHPRHAHAVPGYRWDGRTDAPQVRP